MSWAVSKKGKTLEVAAEVAKQFEMPLGASGLPHEGERQTVQLVAQLIEQCLSTFDPAQDVEVSAHGYMSDSGKGKSFQRLYISIT